MKLFNPWYWICRMMVAICSRKAEYWFRSPHPYWDCKLGKPQPWSVKKYGNRPQDLFYRKWDDRKTLWINRLNRIKP